MTSAVAVRPAPRLAPEPLFAPVLQLLPPPASVAGQAELDLEFATAGPATTPSDGPETMVRGMVQALLEVLDGRRSPVGLQRAVAPDVLSRVVRRAAATSRTRRPAGRPPRIVRLHLSSPRQDVCECAAVVAIDGRVRAVAARVARRGDRWVLDALDIG